LLARGRAGLEGAAREVEELGGTALVIPTDVADPDQVEAAAERAESEYGPIDVWINDAMATIYSEFLDIEPDEFRRATDVTYHGMVWGTRAALRRMSKRNRGTIVQVGSALAFRGIPLQAAYCGAKAAGKNFTESVITEIEHNGWDVHVAMVHIAAFNTTQFTWGRTKLPSRRSPCLRSTSRRSPRTPSTGPPTTTADGSTSGSRPCSTFSASTSRPASSTGTSRRPVTARRLPTSHSTRPTTTTSSSRSTTTRIAARTGRSTTARTNT